MRLQEKLNILQDNHFSEWLKTRREVANEESAKQSMFCVCGRLATGLHESHCTKLSKRITNITIKRLSHLLTV